MNQCLNCEFSVKLPRMHASMILTRAAHHVCHNVFTHLISYRFVCTANIKKKRLARSCSTTQLQMQPFNAIIFRTSSFPAHDRCIVVFPRKFRCEPTGRCGRLTRSLAARLRCCGCLLPNSEFCTLQRSMSRQTTPAASKS